MDQKKKKIYGIFSGLLILLIIGAVTGPQLLFLVQDKLKQDKVYIGERDSMDMTALKADYPKELQSRLNNLAKGLDEGKKYYTYANDYEINMDAYELVDIILYDQEWGKFLMELQLVPEPYYSHDYKGYDIESWKRYVLCDEVFQGGVILMAWYFEIKLDEEVRIDLLVDVEDNTLYVIRFGNVDPYYFSNCPFDNLIGIMPLYWCNYYETSNQKWNNYPEQRIDATSYEKLYMEILAAGKFQVPLFYGDTQLKWEINLTEDEISPNKNLYMGIREIWEIIPELSEK